MHFQIPPIDVEYVHDQRARFGEKGLFQIGALDKPEMELMNEDVEKKRKLEETEEDRKNKEKCRKAEKTVVSGIELEAALEEELGPSEDYSTGSDENDDSFELENPPQTAQNRLHLNMY